MDDKKGHHPRAVRVRSGIQSFEMLMPFRIREILLVSSLYDAFILQAEGQSLEPLLSDYTELNLRYAPRVKRVSTGAEAVDILSGHDRYDMVILTPQIPDFDPEALATEVKEQFGQLPVVLLAYDIAQVQDLQKLGERSPFDHMILWNGDSRILLGVTKLIEDRVNMLHDAVRVGVRAVLLVEDSLNFLSSYLPLLYTEILLQSQRVISESANLSHKLLRLRARPKILLARSKEEAKRIFEEHREHLLGVISDIRLPVRRGEDPDPRAGFEFIRQVRIEDPLLPVLVQSSNPANAKEADRLGAAFVDKNSPRLHHDIRAFMVENFGFGPFIFRLKDRTPVAEAANLRELEEAMHHVPAESLVYHSTNNSFSTWLRARTEFALASQLAPQTIDDFDGVEDLRSFLLDSIHEARRELQRGTVADYDRETFDRTHTFSRIGQGSMGGKGRGLAFINYLLQYQSQISFEGVEVLVPPAVVITTEIFDRFMAENDLYGFALGEIEDDAQLRRRFLRADLPKSLIEDLRALVHFFHGPVAIRSSSLLEDSHLQAFAGVYETHMLPNCNGDDEFRLRDLGRAIKLVYASTYSRKAKSFIRATPFLLEEEKMAVILQPVFGRRHGQLFYPTFSGVARSHNYYPHGPVKPEDGVCSIALGLGQLVVEGEGGLRFCPRYPRNLPHFSTPQDVLENAQRFFYALEMDSNTTQAEFAPLEEPKKFDIRRAQEDGVLSLVGSVYSPENDAIYEGTGRPGIPLVTFASILKYDTFPLANVVDLLLKLGSWGLGSPVEIEFAVDLESLSGGPQRLAFLQMRPMVVSEDWVEIDIEQVSAEGVLCESDRALGNGRNERIRDIVFVDPEDFDRLASQGTHAEIRRLNARLIEEDRPYLLVGPGRWGSSDPCLGIPVDWGSISGARVVVETGFAEMPVAPSEGSHFFNNMTSFHVGYFTVNPQFGEGSLDLAWLRAQEPLERLSNGLRLIRLDSPLTVLIDGRTARGLILKPGEAS